MGTRVGVAVPALATLALACNVEKAKPDPARTAAIRVPRAPDAAAADPATTAADARAALPPAALAAAAQAREAGEKLAMKCFFVIDTTSGTFRDVCEWRAPDSRALHDAVAALDDVYPAARVDAGAGAGAAADPTGPDAAALYFHELHAFAAWADEHTSAYYPAAGTLAHYQTLARAWNGWRPAEAVPIDVGKSRATGLDLAKLQARVGDAGLAWESCTEGPCVRFMPAAVRKNTGIDDY
jgi:hypothetical protein